MSSAQRTKPGSVKRGGKSAARRQDGGKEERGRGEVR